MRNWTAISITLVLTLLGGAIRGLAAPQLGPAAGDAKGVVILDNMGVWRMHHELRPPVIDMGGTFKPALIEQSWMNHDTAGAPAGWQAAEFDDSAWFRGTVPRSIESPWLARLCVRGKFQVTNPALVKDLRLSVDFHGGIIVYVNGNELTRRNMPAGSIEHDTLAEAYPKEAFVDENGVMLFPGNIRWHAPGKAGKEDFWKDRPVSVEMKRRMGLWQRTMEDVAIPAEMLRQGTNVLAIEVVRSPYDKAVEEAKEKFNAGDAQYAYQVFFATCQLELIQVTSADGAGLSPNARRPAGFQVWNSAPAATDFDQDFGDPCEALAPIALSGPRNGMVSGKVVVGDTKPIRGLHGTAGELRGPNGATIPAGNVEVRYGLPWGEEEVSEVLRAAPRAYPYPATPLSCLSDAAPAEVAVLTKDYPPYEPRPVNGAVASVWVTVKIPAGAVPGLYTGELTVNAQGEKPVKVTLQVKAAEWVAPDPKDFTSWVDMIQSPDTLALEYKTPLWSPEHWKQIDHSLSLLGQAGNRTLYVPLIAHTNLGNEESMVRWIRKDGGQYDYDFSVLDHYLDSAIANMGKPRIVIADVWELYMLDASGKLPDDEKYSELRRTRQERMPANVLEQGGKIGLGPLVTVLDKATGTTQLTELPKYGDPIAKVQWKALLTALHDHLARRGLDKALMFGLNSDAWAPKPTVQFFNDILPGTPWVIESHDGFTEGGKLLHGIAPVGYQARVWGIAFSDEDRHDPYRINRAPGDVASAGRMYGWKQPDLIALFERFSMNDFTYARFRYFAEENITGGQRGFGRVGGDMWPVLRNKQGDRAGFVHQRYPESNWRNLTIQTSMLAPGVNGPAATMHFEALCEGLVDTEARIQIEKALTTPALRAKLGEKLAAKCQQHLDERLRLMWLAQSNLQMHAGGYDSTVQYATGWRFGPAVYGQTWYEASRWQERNEELYRLAAEVARKISG